MRDKRLHPLMVFFMCMALISIFQPVRAWSDTRARALTETFLPDLIKDNHSPASPLAHMDDERFFKTNEVIIAYQLTLAATEKGELTNSCFRDPYKDQRATSLYRAQDERARAWIDAYFANFMGRHGEFGRHEVDAFVHKTIDTALPNTPSCRMVHNAFLDSLRFVQRFKK
jgi:hypothetical protein